MLILIRHFILFFCFAIFFTNVNSQQAYHNWTKTGGSISMDIGNSLHVDALGNVYTVGRFQGTVDFDPGTSIYNLTSNGGYDIFVQKLNSSGNLIWAHSFGDTLDDQGNSVVVDNNGNVYITGGFQLTMDADPCVGSSILTSSGYYDLFSIKLDANGIYIWGLNQGGSGTISDIGVSIHIHNQDNRYHYKSFLI